MASPSKNTQLVLLFASIIFVAGLSAFIGYRVATQSAGSAKTTLTERGSVTPKPDSSSHPFVFIRDNNVWIRRGLDEKRITSDGLVSDPNRGLPDVYYRKPVLSPDNMSVAVIRSIGSNSDSRSLQVISLAAPGSPKTVSSDVDWSQDTIAWSSDGSAIYFSSRSPDDYDTKYMNSVSVSTGLVSRVGTFNVQSGCGGGSSDPSDHLTWRENIAGWPVTFSLSPDDSYIVHNSSCTGHGLALFDLMKKSDSALDDKNVGAVFSGNGKTFASFNGSIITIYDAASKIAVKSFTASGPVSALLYGPDNQTLYYTSSTRVDTLSLDDAAAIEILGYSPAEFFVRKTVLHSLVLSTGINTVVASFDAHDARPFATNAMGNTVFLAVIDNATKLYDFFRTKQSRAGSDTHFPNVSIVEVNAENGVSTVLVQRAEQASR